MQYLVQLHVNRSEIVGDRDAKRTGVVTRLDAAITTFEAQVAQAGLSGRFAVVTKIPLASMLVVDGDVAGLDALPVVAAIRENGEAGSISFGVEPLIDELADTVAAVIALARRDGRGPRVQELCDRAAAATAQALRTLRAASEPCPPDDIAAS